MLLEHDEKWLGASSMGPDYKLSEEEVSGPRLFAELDLDSLFLRKWSCQRAVYIDTKSLKSALQIALIRLLRLVNLVNLVKCLKLSCQISYCT